MAKSAAHARDRKLLDAHAALDANRRNAVGIQQAAGLRTLRDLLERAQRDLNARVADLVARGADETFTGVQARATLRQVELVLRQLVPGVSQTVVDAGVRAADQFAAHTAEYMRAADEAYRGVGTQPLALKEASMMEASMQGARSSILRRLASSGTEYGVDAAPHAAKRGVLGRYGVQVVGDFERTLQAGVVARKSRAEMAEDLRNDSPFLRGAPAHWAERIVRTELHHAANAAGSKALKAADEQLGDMLKILSCVFDDRTGADSIAVHGQVRRPGEEFETWFGPCDHPPDRPNDRAVVTPHRMSWPLPEYLKPRPWEDVLARWKLEGRKGAPPERPLMTTVDLSLIGAEPVEEKPEEESEPEAPKERTTEEWAGDMHGAVAGVLDEKSPMSNQIDASAKARNLLRERLTGMGLTSFDLLRGRPGAEALMLMNDDPSALAYHHWNGVVTVRRSEMREAMNGLDRVRQGKEPMQSHQRAVCTLFHEEVHGASPLEKEGYRGVGIPIEEAGTEILARRVARELLKLDPKEHKSVAMPGFVVVGERGAYSISQSSHGLAYDNFIMDVQKEVFRATGTSDKLDDRIERAFVEIRSDKTAKYDAPGTQLRAFVEAKALGLDEKKAEALYGALEARWMK